MRPRFLIWEKGCSHGASRFCYRAVKSKLLPCQRRDDRVQMLFALRQQRIPDHQFTSFIIRISSS